MATPANSRQVTFSLAEDGEHVEVNHDCVRHRAQLHGWITDGQWWTA